MKKVLINCDAISLKNSVLIIIKEGTGVYYTGQSDGIACSHPEVEGYALNIIGDLLMDFDMCSYGCHHISYDVDIRNRLANDLNNKLIKETSSWMFDIYFDFERIDELMEAWVPVLIDGKTFYDVEFKMNKAIIYTSNCD